MFAYKWANEKQYRAGRQKRLVYVLAKIEHALASKFSEPLELAASLSIEHIMPRSWHSHWPLDVEDNPEDEMDIGRGIAIDARDDAINTFGNLTLLTQKLNASISNGPYRVKLEAINKHSRLTLNFELQSDEEWDEESIKSRGQEHAKQAIGIWKMP